MIFLLERLLIDASENHINVSKDGNTGRCWHPWENFPLKRSLLLNIYSFAIRPPVREKLFYNPAVFQDSLTALTQYCFQTPATPPSLSHMDSVLGCWCVVCLKIALSVQADPVSVHLVPVTLSNIPSSVTSDRFNTSQSGVHILQSSNLRSISEKATLCGFDSFTQWFTTDSSTRIKCN